MTPKESELQRIDLTKFETEKQESTNLVSEQTLWARLRRNEQARVRFVESHLSKNLAFQIRAMRDREGWSQQELADRVEMTQTRISLLENPFKGKPTLTTLKRLAAAFDVSLVVRFVSFSQLVKWVTGTAYIEHGLSEESTNVPSFAHEDIESLAALAKLSMREGSIEDQSEERHKLGLVPHLINYQEQSKSRPLHSKSA